MEEDTIDNYLHSTILITNSKPTDQEIEVLLPNNATMRVTHTCNIYIPELPISATQAHLFKELACESLVSIGQLYDVGCTAHFTKQKLYIFYNRKLIM